MYDRLLVPTDGSENARLAAERAIDLAATYDATLHVLYVVEKTRDEPTQKGLAEKLAEDVSEGTDIADRISAEAATANLDIETTVEQDVPRTRIVDYVETHEIDLVVIGSTGADDVADKLLGTVAKYVVNEAPADVFVVRRDEQLA